MRKKIIAVICLIAIFIPTYFAIAYYITAQNAPVSERTVEKLTLEDLDGKQFVFDKESKESKKILSFFIDMNDNAKEVKSLPAQLKGNDYYKATYRSYNKDKVYKYYFTEDPEEAYYVDANRDVFSIREKDAIEFLSMKYAESTYPSSVEPELTVSGMSKLAPYSMDWRYKAGGGEYIATSYTGTKDSSSVYPVSGRLMLDFTNEPDNITVKIKDGSTVIFDDIYEKVTTEVIGETSKKYSVEITAKWYKTSDEEYYGEAVYKFTADVSAPASFYLGENTIQQGEFVVITAKNVNDIDMISFKSEPDISYTPTFYRDGDFVVALVPISLDIEYSPTYKFTLTYGGVTEDLTLTVTPRTTTNLYPTINADTMKKRADSVLNAFEATMKQVVSTNETTRYWSSVFKIPVSKGVHWGYDKKIVVNGGAESFINKGVDYIVPTGYDIQAVNKGKVVYAGETVYSGKMIVIDHGYGLKSWYMNMDRFAVNVGDVVEIGAVIGTTGRTGFSDFSGGGNLHYEVTVNGVQVSPYPLSTEGVKMYLGN